MSAALPIVLAAHGAGAGSDANRRLQERAERLEDGLWRPVRAAFHLGEPCFEDAIALGAGEVITVVPVMLADGYFVRSVLRPRAEAAAAAAGAALRWTAPIGTWPSLHELVARRVRAALVDNPAHTVIIAAHGTRRERRSAGVALNLAERLRSDLGRTVRAAFIDQEPRLEAVLGDARAPVLLVPLLLGGGGHAREDIPRIVERAGRPGTLVLSAVGEDPELDALIIQAIEQCEVPEGARRGAREVGT